MLTKEDYKKIQNWLNANTIKRDRSLRTTSCSGSDNVIIIQDGVERRIRIEDLCTQVLNLEGRDFVNITNNYNTSGITLAEAVNSVPEKIRKEGQIITFKNREGKWEIYQFTGKLLQWDIYDLWITPFNLKSVMVSSTIPDEEDLTKTTTDSKGNSKLCLKDREYSPTSFSGLGRTILRKNIISIHDSIYGYKSINLLEQKDISRENTVYEIRYDFNLNGKIIVIPDNSILEFNGGTISNGGIVLRKTKIHPNNCVLEDLFIDCGISGQYAEGQCIFKDGGPRWYHDGVWYKPAMEQI